MNHDRSIVAILAANIATLLAAAWGEWGLGQLLWPYWMQSVIIGYYARKRMLLLQEFCTKDFKINNRPVEATPATQRQTANFFALHYGAFHVGYLFFLTGFATQADSAGYVPVTNESTGEVMMMHVGHTDGLDLLIYLLLGIGFWLSHRASHREHVRADISRKPNIGTMMFMPYLRIFPMHFTIIFGAMLSGGLAVAFFAILKTVADIGMHRAEHYWLQTERKPKSSWR